MRYLYFIILPFIFSNLANAIEISDFKFGMVCPNEESEIGWICHETNKILISGQGECVYNKSEAPCTWYGFSFNYKNSTESDLITCELTASEPVNHGNPEEVVRELSNKQEYQFKPPKGDGRFFNPQYSLFYAGQSGGYSLHEKTVCKVGNNTLFEFEAEFIYSGM